MEILNFFQCDVIWSSSTWRGSALSSNMERHDKRHSKHHKEKHKKRGHKKSRNHSSGTHDQSYATSNSHKPLVEYSDVSSEALSAPEAGEIDSEASSISRHHDDRHRARKPHSIRTVVDNVISVTTTSRRGTEDYSLTRDSLSAATRKRHSLEYEAPIEESDELRYKKRKEKRKKDKKKSKKKKSRHRSASLESVSADDNVPEVTPVRTSPQRYEKVPVSEWEKPSSPLRNGSCSPVSPTTPPLLRHEHRLARDLVPPLHHPAIGYDPHHRSPTMKWVPYY